MKKIVSLSAAFILIGFNLYAGDLKVTGKLGIGTTNPQAMLDVNQVSSGFTDGFEDNNLSEYTLSGNANWSTTSGDKSTGAYSAKAGTISHNQYTSMKITKTVAAGNITFARKVSSEASFDYLRFYIDGQQKDFWSGSLAWAVVSYAVAAGTHTFEWRYDKDGSVNSYYDTAWIDDITFPAGAAVPAAIFNGGNVGIGTTGPNSKFTVGTNFASVAGITIDTGGEPDSAIVVRKAASKPAFGILPWDSQVYLSSGIYYNGNSWVQHNNDNNNQLFVMDPGAGLRWYASNNGSGSWNVASDVQLMDDSANWVSTVRSTRSGNSFFTGGNVGIGTTNPEAKLQIGNYLKVFDNNSTAADTNYIRGTSNHLVIQANGDLYLNYPENNVGMTRIGETLFVQRQGNVGIGTTNPLSKLSVGGNGYSNYPIYVYGSSGVYADSTDTYGRGIFGRSTGSYSHGVYGYGGSFGVYGYGANAWSYGVYCYAPNNTYGCGGNRSWNYFSDKELKENIVALGEALPKIKRLRGVKYNWKDDSEKKRQVGMIAQEVMEVIPEAVGRDMNGNLTMSDGPIVALLTEAVKEQQRQIEAQQAQIEALIAEVEKLKKKQ